MQHAQKPAPETKAEGRTALWGKDKGGVIELELLHGGTQFLVIFGIYRVDSGKDHGLYVFKAFNGDRVRIVGSGNGISHLYFPGFLDAGDQIAHVAG